MVKVPLSELPNRLPPWLAWVCAGTGPDDNATQRRKVMQANLGAALLIVIVVVFNGVYMAIGNPALVRSGWAQLPFAVLAPLVWAVNRRGHLFRARWLLFALAMAGTSAVIVGGQGTVVGAQVWFLMFAVMPAMFYAASEWRSAVVLGLLNLAIFGWLEVKGWPAHPELATLDGTVLQVLQTSLVLGCIAVVVGVVALSERTAEANERRLLVLAATDVLTGLPNRRAFRDALAAETRRAERSGAALSIAVIDLDHFKAVNDGFGHDGGDAALRHVAGVLDESVRGYDLVARVGGEEFALLMPGTDLGQALQGLERLRESVQSRPFEYGGRRLDITLSAGVAQLAPGMAEEAALQAADRALYRAKREGRNRVVAEA